jgi:hypothetical protein
MTDINTLVVGHFKQGIKHGDFIILTQDNDRFDTRFINGIWQPESTKHTTKNINQLHTCDIEPSPNSDFNSTTFPIFVMKFLHQVPSFEYLIDLKAPAPDLPKSIHQ